MSAAFEFNNDVKGDKAQINQGQNVTASQNNSSDKPPTVVEVIEKVAEVLPTELATDWKSQVQTLAAMPIAQQQEPEQQSAILAICDQIKPHAGEVWKNLAIFGATALETLATRNPVIAGIVEVCKANSSPDS